MNNLFKIKKLKFKRILVTGATGSFGQAFIKYILDNFYDQVERLVVYSRDEYKQYEMSQLIPVSKYPQIRYFIGDIRDESRLQQALNEIELVVHAAALKQVPATEYNPFECIKTNVLGAQNLINACLNNEVKQVIALSTDKAAARINLYGASKLCSDKLFVAANSLTGNKDLSFSVVRYGNVMMSRGSVIPFFLSEKGNGILPITHPDMTRFNITLEQAVDLVLFSISNSIGGEIYVPKLPSYKILDLAEAIAPECTHRIVGIRAGEKIHEEMITSSDFHQTYDFGSHYRILPYNLSKSQAVMLREFGAKRVEDFFSYNSGKNDQWLSINAIKELINNELNSQSKPVG